MACLTSHLSHLLMGSASYSNSARQVTPREYGRHTAWGRSLGMWVSSLKAEGAKRLSRPTSAHWAQVQARG